MNVDQLIGLLESNKQRRSEKVRHLNLKHQPVIHEVTVAEKEEIQKKLTEAKTVEDKDTVVIEVVIRSMCGWDEAGEVTPDHIKHIKSIYSSDVIIELYKCIVDFSYLGEQAIVKAKKS